MTTGFATYPYEVRLVREWISGQPALSALLQEAARVEPDLDVAQWAQSCRAKRGLFWPTSTEAGRAALIWEWLQSLGDNGDPMGLGISRERQLDAVARETTEAVLQPLFDYLGEKIGAESGVLHLLERYVRKLEWFDRDTLHARYLADTYRGEAIYDGDLRRFLFDQGLDMPFSQPKSASGLSDALGELNSDDPLVCEVKLFDGANHDRRGVISGVHQVVNYAQDYGKSIAYLIVINLSGRPLEFPHGPGSKVWPPHVDLAGVRVHLVSVRALPTATASKLGKAKPVTFSLENFIDPDVSGID